MKTKVEALVELVERRAREKAQVAATEAEIGRLVGEEVRAEAVVATTDEKKIDVEDLTGEGGDLFRRVRDHVAANPGETHTSESVLAAIGARPDQKKVVGTYLWRLRASGDLRKVARGAFRARLPRRKPVAKKRSKR